MNGKNSAVSLRAALPPELARRAGKLKGRQPDGVSLDEVDRLLGPAPRRRDLLIEYLHRLNDAYGALRSRHLTALAAELNLPRAEIYEVATFYHHFEVTDSESPAALTVRVCGGLPCHLAGAKELIERLPAILGREVRVEKVPCMGRCEQAPAAEVGRRHVIKAEGDTGHGGESTLIFDFRFQIFDSNLKSSIKNLKSLLRPSPALGVSPLEIHQKLNHRIGDRTCRLRSPFWVPEFCLFHGI